MQLVIYGIIVLGVLGALFGAILAFASKIFYVEVDPKQEQERQTNEALLAEDAVQTTAYLANAPDCCSGAEQLDHVLGMLGSDVMDDGIYHSEDQHPKRNDHSDPVLSL